MVWVGDDLWCGGIRRILADLVDGFVIAGEGGEGGEFGGAFAHGEVRARIFGTWWERVGKVDKVSVGICRVGGGWIFIGVSSLSVKM